MKECRNGYGMNEDEYSLLLDKLYGFEEYYYYNQDKHYKDYLYVINELDKIKRNVPMDESHRNAIIGWYIFFKNSKRIVDYSHICVRITDACQLKCKHCYQQNTTKNNKHMTYDEFVYLFSKHPSIAKKFVHTDKTLLPKSCDLEGGETTLNPDLCKIIKFLNGKDIFVRILTNGIHVSDELIDVLKINPNNRVQVSLDGLKETHEFIRGTNTFQKSIDSINKFLKNGIEVNANITLHESNFHDYSKLKHNIIESGCTFGHMLYIPVRGGVLSFLSKENLMTYLKENNIPKNIGSCNRTFRCCVGKQIVITNDGCVMFCGHGFDAPIANYFTDDDETIVEKMKKFTLRWRSVPVYCFDCKKVSNCLGGMLCTNLLKGDNIVFNSEDKICKMMEFKEQDSLYGIQTIL